MTKSICNDCEHSRYCKRAIRDNGHTTLTGCSRFNQREKQTNADRIRSMTDEELAEEYIRIYNQLPRHTDSWAWLRDWLKQEASET